MTIFHALAIALCLWAVVITVILFLRWARLRHAGYPIYFDSRLNRTKATAALATRAAEDSVAKFNRQYQKDHPELEPTYRGVPMSRVAAFCREEREKTTKNDLPAGWAYRVKTIQ